jgi:hypothetical protein
MSFKFCIFEDNEYCFIETMVTAFVKFASRCQVRFQVLMVAVIMTVLSLVVALCSAVLPFQSNLGSPF